MILLAGLLVAVVVILFVVAAFCVALLDNEHVAQMEAMDVACGDDPMTDPYIKGYHEAYKKGSIAVIGYELRHFFS